VAAGEDQPSGGTASVRRCGVRVLRHAVSLRGPDHRAASAAKRRAEPTGQAPDPGDGAPTFLIRRDVLDIIGLVDEDIPGSYGEDYDLLLRAARRGPIVAVERPLVDVYWHPRSFFADRWQTIVDGLSYLLDKHPELRSDKRGLARIQGQIAFAQAAMSRRSPAFVASRRALANNPLERRAYVALAVAFGAVPAASIARMANRRGRGI